MSSGIVGGETVSGAVLAEEGREAAGLRGAAGFRGAAGLRGAAGFLAAGFFAGRGVTAALLVSPDSGVSGVAAGFRGVREVDARGARGVVVRGARGVRGFGVGGVSGGESALTASPSDRGADDSWGCGSDAVITPN